MILDDILAHKCDEVAARKHATPRSALRERPLWHEARRGFRAALAVGKPRRQVDDEELSPGLFRFLEPEGDRVRPGRLPHQARKYRAGSIP